MKPEGVTIHVTRVLLKGSPMEALRRMDQETEKAAELLATAGVDLIVHGCTTGSMLGGHGWDQEIIHRIERLTHIPATTTTTGVMQAIAELGVGRISIASPYGEPQNLLVKNFLEANGTKVIRMRGLGFDDRRTWLSSPPETTYRLACEVDAPEADAVFISCTNFKSITVIDELEKKLQKYVFSSNTATLFDVLKRLNFNEPIRGYGKLLAANR